MEMFNEKYAVRRKYQTNEVLLHDIIEAGTFCWNLHNFFKQNEPDVCVECHEFGFKIFLS